MTGSDVYYARSNRENGDQITPQCVIVLVTNEVPDTNKSKPMKNRIRIIPFLSIWAMVCPETEEEQFIKAIFKMDKDFDSQVDTFGGPLLWIMVQFYPEYLDIGLHNIPTLVEEYTNQYWEEKDMYFQFAGEMIQHTNDPNDIITVAEAQDIFNEWYGRVYPKHRAITRPVLITELSRIWKKPVGNKWTNIIDKRKVGMSIQLNLNPFEGLQNSNKNYIPVM